jgi:hypothetical protein
MRPKSITSIGGWTSLPPVSVILVAVRSQSSVAKYTVHQVSAVPGSGFAAMFATLRPRNRQVV